jgi:hypothetical protein
MPGDGAGDNRHGDDPDHAANLPATGSKLSPDRSAL